LQVGLLQKLLYGGSESTFIKTCCGGTVVGFITTFIQLVFESRSWQDALDTTLICDKSFQWLAAGCWFSPGTRVLSTNKTDILS